MDTTQADFSEFFFQPTVVLLFAGILVMVLAVHGLAMKWSLALVDGGSVGFLGACTTATVATLVAGIMQFVLSVLFGADPISLAAYGIAGAVLTIAVLERCNPITAGLAYLLYLILGTIGMVPVALVCAASVYLAIDSGMIQPPTTVKSDVPSVTWVNHFAAQEGDDDTTGSDVALRNPAAATPDKESDWTAAESAFDAPAIQTRGPHDSGSRGPSGVQTNPFAR